MADNQGLPDKEYLYGNYLKTQRWQDNLTRKMTHQALDIPDEDVSIIKYGLGWKELAVLAGAITGGAWLMKADAPAPPPQPPAAVDTDTKYELDFVEPHTP